MSDLDFQLTFLVGRGIGRYGSAQLPDVTVRPNGELATVEAYQTLAGVIYRPTAAWTVYSYVGLEHADSQHYAVVVDGVTLGYGYGSPLYDNSGCHIEGSTLCAANTRDIEQATLGTWWKFDRGWINNFQVGAQISYTRRETFDGIGGDPNVGMTVGMVSFRYYPYQK
jgi:hypothetical protein